MSSNSPAPRSSTIPPPPPEGYYRGAPAPEAAQPNAPAQKVASGAPAGALLRVAGLALVLGLGITGVAIAMPAIVPTDTKAPPMPASTEKPWGAGADEEARVAAARAAAAPAGMTAPGSPVEVTADNALPGLVAAITTEGDVRQAPGSKVPRPEHTTRIYSASLDGAQTLTVYSGNGSYELAIAAYAKALKAQGYATTDMKERKDDGKAKDEDGEEAAKIPKNKAVRLFTKGNSQAIVTASQSEDGAALISIVEGPKGLATDDDGPPKAVRQP